MTRLQVREWGHGDRVALLIHGLSSSSLTWWQLGPILARRGYRVVAPDLTGHGDSARARYSRERWATDLLTAAPHSVELALGHSLGGVLLAMIVETVRPRRAVYEDPAWQPDDPAGYGAVQPALRAMKQWGTAQIRAASPSWGAEAVDVRLDELSRWDPDTTRMDYLETAYIPVRPLVPSLIVRADPSTLIDDARAEQYRAAGFEIRTVPDTGHFVHVDDIAGFVDRLDGWL